MSIKQKWNFHPVENSVLNFVFILKKFERYFFHLAKFQKIFSSKYFISTFPKHFFSCLLQPN